MLVDTSAWIECLRDTGSPICQRVDDLLATEIATCDVARMEVIAGARDEQPFPQSRWTMNQQRRSNEPVADRVTQCASSSTV